jgi:DNA-binding NtrC family response regulator
MQRAQVIVCEPDGRLAELLRDSAGQRRWWLREVRQAKSILEALSAGGVLVLKVGRDLENELGLLEKVSWLYPDVPTVVVGDTENPPLAELAWDLGARLVLFPPLPRAYLPEVIAGLMQTESAT